MLNSSLSAYIIWLYACTSILSEANSGSGWNITERVSPDKAVENVPIPDVLPTDINGECIEACLFVSNETHRLWTAAVDPTPTLIMDLSENSRVLSKVKTVVAPLAILYTDSNLAVLSVPPIWSATRYLYVAIPAVVDPIPTTLVLIVTLSLTILSNFNLIIPLSTVNPKVPI